MLLIALLLNTLAMPVQVMPIKLLIIKNKMHGENHQYLIIIYPCALKRVDYSDVVLPQKVATTACFILVESSGGSQTVVKAFKLQTVYRKGTPMDRTTSHQDYLKVLVMF